MCRCNVRIGHALHLTLRSSKRTGSMSKERTSLTSTPVPRMMVSVQGVRICQLYPSVGGPAGVFVMMVPLHDAKQYGPCVHADMSEEEMGDEEDLDILGDAGPGPASATPSGRVILNSLPVTVADINSALEREKLQAQQEAAAAARPCSAHGDGSNEKGECDNSDEVSSVVCSGLNYCIWMAQGGIPMMPPGPHKTLPLRTMAGTRHAPQMPLSIAWKTPNCRHTKRAIKPGLIYHSIILFILSCPPNLFCACCKQKRADT